MKTPLFFKQKPVFGIDIGRGTVKVAQLELGSGAPQLIGYGFSSFDPAAFDDKGVIIDVETVAKSTFQLITEHMIGGIGTDRVVATVPSSRSYRRILSLPKMEPAELDGAVRLEAEQYVPIPLDELYIDYEVMAASDNKKDDTQEVYMVAIPSAVIDSYLEVFSALDLEVAAIEPSRSASIRSIAHAHPIENTSIIVDFGSRSSDLSIYDGKTIRVTGTAKRGGEDITETLVQKLGITKRQAFHGKARYGINQDTKQGKEIFTHSKPILDDLVSEIKRMNRYYKGRDEGNADIQNLIMIGGGANLPGLEDYLAKQTKMQAVLANPWTNIETGSLQEPNKLETTLYTNVIGNALIGTDTGVAG